MYIELKNVSKKIKGIDILDDVSLRMESGKIYGFRGKNGSGKTMLMRAIEFSRIWKHFSGLLRFYRWI